MPPRPRGFPPGMNSKQYGTTRPPVYSTRGHGPTGISCSIVTLHPQCHGGGWRREPELVRPTARRFTACPGSDSNIHAGPVKWWGRRADMPAVFAQASIVCLPSYREGLPKVLIEVAV